jgi:hypothetical protein
MLWKFLEIICDFIFHFLQLWLSSRRRSAASYWCYPPRELLSYVLPVLPELFDEQTDRAHRSYHSAICGGELGTVRFRGLGHYMPLHPGWCLKYVIRHLRIFVFPHLNS